MTTRDLNNQKHTLCCLKQSWDNGLKVQNNLALTPNDIRKLTERGMAVSTQQLSAVNDPESLGQIPLEDTRGMDINTAWELQQKSRSVLSLCYKSLKNKK